MRWAAVLGVGLAVGGAMCAARAAGWLEWADLRLYDAAVAVRAGAAAERPPITLVRIREEEIHRHGHPLPDAVLARALEQIARAHPSAIGVDLYRDVPVGDRAGRAALAALAARIPDLVFVEKLAEPGVPGVAAPEFAVDPGALAFNDVVADADGVLRRGLLILWDERSRPSIGLALQLALHHLRAEGIELGPDPEHAEYLRLGHTTFPPLEATDGGYAGIDARGYQVLLDLRAERSFAEYTFDEALAGRIPAEALRDRIAILGTTAASVKDSFQTSLLGRPIPGIAVHAQLADQIVRWAHGAARPMRFWSKAGAIGWTLGWSVGVAGIAALAAGPWTLGVGVLGAIGLLLGASALLFGAGVWVPAAGPLAASLASGGIVVVDAMRRARAERAAVMDMFGRFVSKPVADELWQRRSEFMDGNRPRSQRLVITAMLTDLKGYTGAAEKMDPAELMEWVNEYMDAMTQVIEEHGGFVDDYSGDGIKANFGAPLRHEGGSRVEHDARAGVRCALAMGRALEQLDRDWERRGLPTARMRIGLHTGEVVVGSLGSHERMKYTTVGDTVNTAARLESFQKEEFEAEAANGSGALFRILISGATHRQLGDGFETASVGEHILRGRGEPIAIHRVYAERQPNRQEDLAMKHKRAPRSSLAILFAVMAAAGPGAAEQKKSPSAHPSGASGTDASGKPAASPQQKAPAKGGPLTVYVPPSRGEVGARTGGGTRGNADAPRIAVLAPDHIGLTTRAQPALAWYLSAATAKPIEFTVIADNAAEPLAVKRLPGPIKAGIHVVDFAKEGIQLEEGTTYNWYVALVLDPKARDADVVAGGKIQRRNATPELTAELAGGDSPYRVLARNGIWYDAIADLSTEIAAASPTMPAGRDLRAERASLLEQVGVGAAALYDRESGDVSDTAQ
ncbi:MAG TPA: CHASE2 domain-containing protein [Myxococcota bacterium]|nr:CHASE2 domain-containing protein [Myxococcota bacterium]